MALSLCVMDFLFAEIFHRVCKTANPESIHYINYPKGVSQNPECSFRSKWPWFFFRSFVWYPNIFPFISLLLSRVRVCLRLNIICIFISTHNNSLIYRWTFFPLFFMAERLLGKMSKMKVALFFSPFLLSHSVEVSDFPSLLLEFEQQRKCSMVAVCFGEREGEEKRRNKSVPHPKCMPNEKWAATTTKWREKIPIKKREKKRNHRVVISTVE